MSPFRRNAGAIVGINVQLLFAAASAVFAWAIWPATVEWWGLGMVSVLFGMGALAGMSNAIGAMRAIYTKERALADYMAQGRAPKSARLASNADLKRAGMLE